MKNRNLRKERIGIVTGNKMEKSIVSERIQTSKMALMTFEDLDFKTLIASRS